MKNLLFALTMLFALTGCTNPDITCCYELLVTDEVWSIDQDIEFLGGDTISYNLTYNAPEPCIFPPQDLDSNYFKLGFYWREGSSQNNTCLLNSGVPAFYEFSLAAGQSKNFIFPTGLRHPDHLIDPNWVWYNFCTSQGMTTWMRQESQCFYNKHQIGPAYGPAIADTSLCGHAYPLNETKLFPFTDYNDIVVLGCPSVTFPKDISGR